MQKIEDWWDSQYEQTRRDIRSFVQFIVLPLAVAIVIICVSFVCMSLAFGSPGGP